MITSNATSRNRWIAIVGTLLFHVGLLLVLLLCRLYYRYPPEDFDPKEDMQKEILFGGEYVMLGDVMDLSNSRPSNASMDAAEVSKQPQNAASDLIDAGEADHMPKELISTEADSPMKVKKTEKKEEPKGVNKSEIAQQEKQRLQEEAERKKIKDRVKFGSSSQSGSGSTGLPSGNSSTVARSVQPGIGGLSGYTLSSWGRPSSPSEGTVTIQVKVNARGKVISAKYVSGTGAAASNSAVRRSCEAAALKSQFSVPVGVTNDALGTITWHFE